MPPSPTAPTLSTWRLVKRPMPFLRDESLTKAPRGAQSSRRTLQPLTLPQRCLALLRGSERKDGAKLLIAQPKPKPEKSPDVDGKQRVAEERVSDANVGGDGAAQVASPQDRPQHRGAWNQVQDQASELDDAQREDHAFRVTHLFCPLHRHRVPERLHRCVPQQEQDG